MPVATVHTAHVGFCTQNAMKTLRTGNMRLVSAILGNLETLDLEIVNSTVTGASVKRMMLTSAFLDDLK